MDSLEATGRVLRKAYAIELAMIKDASSLARLDQRWRGRRGAWCFTEVPVSRGVWGHAPTEKFVFSEMVSETPFDLEIN